jgi:predicted PurR-regulated permease PerM
MSPGQPTERRRRWSATGVLAFLVAIAALHVAAPVFIPVALAIIIAFVLSPLTGWLERRLGSAIAVAVVVALAWAMLGGVAWGVSQQMMTFTRELPEYRDQLRRRVAELRGMTLSAGVEQIESTLGELAQELEPSKLTDPPVVVVRSPRAPIITAATVMRVSASAGLVTLLVIFVLLERQALRNRIVQLAGHGRLAMTTRALGDASVRISRYLLTQTTLNVTFGVAAGLGLALLGIPYALGWGVLAAILKFVPFVGFWAAMAPPVLLSVATAQGWTQPALVAGLYVALAVGSTMLLEPILHAQRLGVSRIALVLGLAFWAWLWGPVGLVIATPLTVCLIVLGRHVPECGISGY